MFYSVNKSRKVKSNSMFTTFSGNSMLTTFVFKKVWLLVSQFDSTSIIIRSRKKKFGEFIYATLAFNKYFSYQFDIRRHTRNIEYNREGKFDKPVFVQLYATDVLVANLRLDGTSSNTTMLEHLI